MKQEERAHSIAAIGTIIVLVAIGVLLWYMHISAPQQDTTQGVEIAFEEEIEPPTPKIEQPSRAAQSAPALVEASPKLQSPTPKVAPVLTQEEEEALQIARAQKEKERKQNEAIAKAQRMADLFGQTSSDEVDNGVGGKGERAAANPLGKGTTGGNDWSLDGRRLIGSLPKPTATFNQEGKVVVWITVDKNGNVISARAGQGTDISDESTRQLAVKYAMKAKFDMVDHPNAALGTITYYFKNK